MKLTRVQVPDFRVLKNIDIEFEKEFFRSIFPLGSQNGGGKSTLLQLIFTLLHCSTVPERKEYLQNLLQGFQVPEDATERELATICIWDGKQEIELKFLVVHETYIKNLLAFENEYNNEIMRLSILNEIDKNKNQINNTEKEINILEKAIKNLDNYQKIENESIRNSRLMDVRIQLRKFVKFSPELPIEELKENVEARLLTLQLNLSEFRKRYDNNARASKIIYKNLEMHDLIYICNYLYDLESNQESFLLCKAENQTKNENLDIAEVKYLLEKVAQKIFLAAPITQVFLFTSQESKKLLLQKNINSDYYTILKLSKSQLSGLFTYDFVPVDALIQAFKTARDKDFREAIKTEGEYGKHYKILLNDLNLLLVNKKVNISEDFYKVTFKITRDNVDIEINPEDLSHGEMKRLSIYMWIKYGNIPEGSIVLMDEIEIALHPDWQYQIVLDLQEWAPSNQYILATHSYELCQSLVPAQVKEIEPKLIKSEGNH